MEAYLGALRRVALFHGMGDRELLSMLDCLGARLRQYSKGDVIFHAGDPATHLGAVLTGQVQVSRTKADGQRVVMGTAAASFSFQRRMGRRAFAILPLAALSALCFPLPMGSFEFGGPAEFLRPYLYDGIFYSADGLPSVLGPVLLFVSLCVLAASLCQILRRDPYEE